MDDLPYIDIHTHSSRPGEMCVVSYEIGSGQPFPKVPYVSAGVHPWDAETVNMEEAVKFLKETSLAAIGEIGLDFSRQIDRNKQIDVFKTQLALAEERNLPVILHCVKGYNEVLNIISGFNLRAVVFHSYIGSPELTANIIKKGYYISISEQSLKSQKTLESISNTSLASLFAETDTSDMSVKYVYDKISVIKKVEVRELKQFIFSNFKKVVE